MCPCDFSVAPIVETLLITGLVGKALNDLPLNVDAVLRQHDCSLAWKDCRLNDVSHCRPDFGDILRGHEHKVKRLYILLDNIRDRFTNYCRKAKSQPEVRISSK